MDELFDVKCVSDCLMMIRIIVCEVVVAVLLVYAPQTRLTMAKKELFYNNLQNLVQTIDVLQTLSMFTLGIHGGYGFVKHIIDGERILEFAAENNLVAGSSKFVKKDKHLIKYQSGGCSSHIDYILLQCKKFHFIQLTDQETKSRNCWVKNVLKIMMVYSDIAKKNAQNLLISLYCFIQLC